MKDEIRAVESDRVHSGGVDSAASGSSFILHPSSLHAIRLGPPWQAAATETGTRHARKFGRPRTLDAGERLWLVCDRVPGAGEVRVNGTSVGAPGGAGAFAADITPLLEARNEVVIDAASGEELGAVRLEVRKA